MGEMRLAMLKKKNMYKVIEQDSQPPQSSDYETYLNTKKLLSCQKHFSELINGDELQFQTVHQTEELWMKLISYTLINICDYMKQCNTHRVMTLFRRVHKIQEMMINLLGLLETMSPKEYQQIRVLLGNGSGKTSPGFRSLLHAIKPLWETYQSAYLTPNQLTIEKIYNSEYTHNNAYAIAEAMIEFDALFARFYKRHFELIERTIGEDAKSLKGRDVQLLRAREQQKLFPELWEVRSRMTNEWGSQYGYERASLNEKHKKRPYIKLHSSRVK
jgi:tryptophan 2,3-dioxygenase